MHRAYVYAMARRLSLSLSSSKSGKSPSVTKSATKRSRGIFFPDVQKPPGSRMQATLAMQIVYFSVCWITEYSQMDWEAHMITILKCADCANQVTCNILWYTLFCTCISSFKNNVGNKCPLELLRYLDSSYLYRRGKEEIIRADIIPLALEGTCYNKTKNYMLINNVSFQA